MNASNSLVSRMQASLENRVPPPMVVLIVGAAMGALARFTPGFDINAGTRLAVGIALIALGLGIVVTGARTFWKARTTIDPVNLHRASSLVVGGIFSLTRNPMYVGFTTVLIGWAACLGSLWALIGPVVFVLYTTRFQIMPEERMMMTKFGAEYEAYRARVRRWL